MKWKERPSNSTTTSKQSQPIYDPKSTEPLNEKDADTVTAMLEFALSMAKNSEEMQDFFRFNKDLFQRITEDQRNKLRHQWKTMQREFLQEKMDV